MQLVKLTENILVNPEDISIVEFVVMGGTKYFMVTVNDRQIVATVNPSELLQDLIKVGVEPHAQFWAG